MPSLILDLNTKQTAAKKTAIYNAFNTFRSYDTGILN